MRKGEKGETVIYVSKVFKEDKDGARRAIPFLKASQFSTSRSATTCQRRSQTRMQTRTSSIQTRVMKPPMHSSPRQAPTFVMAKLRAYYRPLGDYVNLPHFETFTNCQRLLRRRIS